MEGDKTGTAAPEKKASEEAGGDAKIPPGGGEQKI